LVEKELREKGGLGEDEITTRLVEARRILTEKL
jgi:hypothetical protein